MDAEKWMKLHPTIDIKKAVEKIKNVYGDDLYQIIMFGPSVREDYRKRKDINVSVVVILHTDDNNDRYSKIIDELLETYINPYSISIDDFRAAIPFNDLYNSVAFEGIVFYGPEIKNRPSYDLRAMPVAESYSERHDSTYRFIMARNIGWLMALANEEFGPNPVELTEKWLLSKTAYDVYRYGHSVKEKYNKFTRYKAVYDDWMKETSLKCINSGVVTICYDESPMFWYGYMLQCLIYKDGLPPAALLKKYDMKRIIVDLEILRTMCVYDAVYLLSEKYTLSNWAENIKDVKIPTFEEEKKQEEIEITKKIYELFLPPPPSKEKVNIEELWEKIPEKYKKQGNSCSKDKVEIAEYIFKPFLPAQDVSNKDFIMKDELWKMVIEAYRSGTVDRLLRRLTSIYYILSWCDDSLLSNEVNMVTHFVERCVKYVNEVADNINSDPSGDIGRRQEILENAISECRRRKDPEMGRENILDQEIINNASPQERWSRIEEVIDEYPSTEVWDVLNEILDNELNAPPEKKFPKMLNYSQERQILDMLYKTEDLEEVKKIYRLLHPDDLDATIQQDAEEYIFAIS